MPENGTVYLLAISEVHCYFETDSQIFISRFSPHVVSSPFLLYWMYHVTICASSELKYGTLEPNLLFV